MIPSYLASVANHLWQTTIFVLAAGLLTLLLRGNRAQVRYAVWLAASLKFLLPFSILVWAGGHLGWNPMGRSGPSTTVPILAGQMSRPFATSLVPPVTPEGAPPVSLLPALLVVLWGCGVLVVAARWWWRWQRLRTVARSARPLAGFAGQVPVLCSAELGEPGLFGIWRPVVLLPSRIVKNLSPSEFEAILEHEFSHARRHDNLAAAAHMAVEALFWFYPLVWWIERQLMKERERACDEDVLRRGRDRRAYAEGILKVCRFSVESPLMCAAGITGADLTKRIEEIMTHRITRTLEPGKKLLLAALGIAAVAAPVVIGMANAPRLRAQPPTEPPVRFEVASIKENPAQDKRSVRMQILPGGRLVARDVPLMVLIGAAYNVPPFAGSRLTGGPDWIRQTQYDIEATAEQGAIPDGASQNVLNEKVRLMLQALLADRFKMIVRRETKELPIYVITVAKGGPKLQKAAIEEKDCAEKPKGPDDPAWCHGLRGGQGQGIHGQAVTLGDVAKFVEGFADRPVEDQTGLKGLYNIQTEGWVPMRLRPPRPPGQDPSPEDLAFADPTRPTIYQILERLGLKLEQQRGPVEAYEIVSAEKPSEN